MKTYHDIVGDGGSRVLEQVADQRARIADGLAGVRHLVAVGSGKGGVGPKTRRGTPCQCPGMKTNSRCRVHGGLSTGPKTPEGIERIRQSRTKHGMYSQRFKAQRAQGRETMRRLKALVQALENAKR